VTRSRRAPPAALEQRDGRGAPPVAGGNNRGRLPHRVCGDPGHLVAALIWARSNLPGHCETKVSSAGRAISATKRREHRSRRVAAQRLSPATRSEREPGSKILAPDELQSRPVVIESGDLDIHEPDRQDDLAQPVLADIADMARSLAWPRDPEAPVDTQCSRQDRKAAFQPHPLVKESHDDVERSAGTFAQGNRLRETLDPPARRLIQQGDDVAVLDAQLPPQGCARIGAHHGLAIYRRETAAWCSDCSAGVSNAIPGRSRWVFARYYPCAFAWGRVQRNPAGELRSRELPVGGRQMRRTAQIWRTP
jgi:hypothetical protein